MRNAVGEFRPSLGTAAIGKEALGKRFPDYENAPIVEAAGLSCHLVAHDHSRPKSSSDEAHRFDTTVLLLPHVSAADEFLESWQSASISPPAFLLLRVFGQSLYS